MTRSAVAGMTAYTLDLRDADVKLNQNESPFDFPRELKERALSAMLERPWNIYPDFESAALRKAIATSRGLSPDNILVGNGSNELLAATVETYVGPGTPVIFPRPTFALYEKLITVAGGLAVPIDFDPDSGLLPLDAMLEAVARYEGAVVIACSPNNPTGGVLPDGGLETLLARGAMVLLDRAYGDFDTQQYDASPLPNLVTFRTFSKAFGLAALRVGWLESTPENCREIRKVKLPYSLNVISEAIAILATENLAMRDRNVAAILTERKRVTSSLVGLRVAVFPSSANFVTFRVGDSGVAFEALLKRGILVRDVSSYPRLRNCLRVSIGSRAQNDAFLSAMKEIV